MSGNKYKAKKTTVDNIVFDSKKESARYCELKVLLKAGEISELELQKRFDIDVNGKRICYYLADFVYKDKQGNVVVEDVKGMRRGSAYAMFRLKKKLVEACHGVEIVEI